MERTVLQLALTAILLLFVPAVAHGDCASSTCTGHVHQTNDPPGMSMVCDGVCGMTCGDGTCGARTVGRWTMCACGDEGEGNNDSCITVIVNNPGSISAGCLTGGCANQCATATVGVSGGFNITCACSP